MMSVKMQDFASARLLKLTKNRDWTLWVLLPQGTWCRLSTLLAICFLKTLVPF
jgi:hypothetical protein